MVGAADKNLGDYTIGEITIIRHNIFDLSKPKENGVIGRWANKLHVVTQEKVIRQELLFKEGDPYSERLIEESERNLRDFYKFLTDIEITVYPDPQTKTVDVVVNTRDQWSLRVGGTFGGTSGNPETGLDTGEINLMGSGQNVTYNIRNDNSGFSQSVGYKDTTLLDTRYTLDARYKILPYEKRYGLLLAKPFFSLDTKRAHGLSYLRSEHDDPSMSFYSHRSSYSQRLVGFYGFGSRFGDDDVIRTSLKLSYGELYVKNYGNAATGVNIDNTNTTNVDVDNTDTTDVNVDNTDTTNVNIDSTNVNRDNKVGITTRLLFNPYEYDKATYITKFREVEDIALGLTVTLSLAARLETFGSTSSDVAAGVRLYKNYHVGERDYFLTLFEIRRNDDFFNRHFALFNLRYYMRRLKYQTFFMRAQLLYSESKVNSFYLGGDNGLRGYEADKFRGKNRIILNLEDRIFTYKTMLYGLVEPGFVVFVDAGNTWNGFSGDKLKELYGGFGVGLRVALLKAPGISLVTLDYGHSFDLSLSPVITFGMEGAF